jgi:hypothetical protein
MEPGNFIGQPDKTSVGPVGSPACAGADGDRTRAPGPAETRGARRESALGQGFKGPRPRFFPAHLGFLNGLGVAKCPARRILNVP